MEQSLKRRARELAGLLFAALLYYSLARMGMAVFSLKPSNITLLWLPSGIALLMSIRWNYRAFPFVALASFAANLPGMLTIPGPAAYGHAAICAFADGSAGLLAAYFFRRHLPSGLAHVRDLLPFGLWLCIVTTTFTSLILSVDLAAGGYIAWSEVPALFLQLILADSLGILLVFQIYQGWRDNRHLSRRDLAWLAGSLTLAAILLTLGFTVLPGSIYFVVPLLLVLSFNVGLLGVGAMSSIVMISIIAATAHNVGPFVAADALDSNLRLMAFVFASGLTILGMALQNRQLVQAEHSRLLWQEAAHRDHLTGLINRRGFVPRLQDLHKQAVRHGKTYSLAILDLDHFKNINDTHGHQSGDEVLCVAAAVIANNCRPIDSIARLGGEEFVILFPELKAQETVSALERIRSEFENSKVPGRHESISATVSIGVTSFAYAHEDDSHVVARADRALYAAKARGRNCVIVDEPAA